MLIIELQKGRDITIGKLGTISFASGYYVYVGSAVNGLSPRIARHLKSEKSLHWHIDYFLKEARINEIIYSETTKEKECALASHIAMRLTPILRFGCSDCHCRSHLYFAEDKQFLKKIVYSGFKKNSLIPNSWYRI